ncbi:MAG: DctP family TRAP transporter solute-binding subunit [Lachnospiraceae bacterium]|nr:DctP family TRAP transporter solute-binding subunit [Lachnospiraceae bacterium]
MKKLISLILVSAMVLGALSGCGNSNKKETGAPAQKETKTETGEASEYEEATIKVAHIFAESHALHKGLQKWSDITAEKTNGKVKIEVYPNGVLGSENEGLQQVIQGTLPACLVSAAVVFQNFDGRANVEELPFLWKDAETANAAYDGEFGQAFAKDIINPLGLETLCFFANGFRHFTNNVKPITKPEDLKGLKLRSSPLELRIQMFEGLGASITPMTLGEVYTALQQGTVDGQENPFGIILTANLAEVQKYLSISGHIYNAATLVINDDFWASLPENTQKALKEAADEAKVYQREINIKEDAEALEKLKELGMEINEVDLEAFKEATKPVWDYYTEKYGSDLVDLALKYANK